MDIRELRKSISLSQYKLARIIKVSDGKLSEWERKKKPIPDKMVQKITQVIEDFKNNPEKLNRTLKKKSVSSYTKKKTKKKTPKKLDKPMEKSKFNRNQYSKSRH